MVPLRRSFDICSGTGKFLVDFLGLEEEKVSWVTLFYKWGFGGLGSLRFA